MSKETDKPDEMKATEVAETVAINSSAALNSGTLPEGDGDVSLKSKEVKDAATGDKLYDYQPEDFSSRGKAIGNYIRLLDAIAVANNSVYGADAFTSSMSGKPGKHGYVTLSFENLPKGVSKPRVILNVTNEIPATQEHQGLKVGAYEAALIVAEKPHNGEAGVKAEVHAYIVSAKHMITANKTIGIPARKAAVILLIAIVVTALAVYFVTDGAWVRRVERGEYGTKLRKPVHFYDAEEDRIGVTTKTRAKLKKYDTLEPEVAAEQLGSRGNGQTDDTLLMGGTHA